MPARPAARRLPQASRAESGGRGGRRVALKDALLAEIRGGKSFFYNTVVAQAQSIDVSGDTVAFAFLPTHRTLREQFEQNAPWIEAAAERMAGRKVAVVSLQVDAGGAPAAAVGRPPTPSRRRPTASAI